MRLRVRNSLPQGTPRSKAKYIKQALEEVERSLIRAAKLLCIPRQSLANILKTRHRKLMRKRAPSKRRKRSIIKDKVE